MLLVTKCYGTLTTPFKKRHHHQNCNCISTKCIPNFFPQRLRYTKTLQPLEEYFRIIVFKYHPGDFTQCTLFLDMRWNIKKGPIVILVQWHYGKWKLLSSVANYDDVSNQVVNTAFESILSFRKILKNRHFTKSHLGRIRFVIEMINDV